MHQRIQNGSAISQSSRAFTPRRNRAQKEQHRCDRIRVLQLAVCLLLFFLVAVGNGVCPDKMERIGEQIRVLTTQDVDLRAAFSRLGESVVGEESSLHQLQEFCEEVFAPVGQPDVQLLSSAPVTPPEPDRILPVEIKYLTTADDPVSLTNHYFYSSYQENTLPLVHRSIPTQAIASTPEDTQTETAIPAVRTVLLDVEYSGKALPANYTMNELSFGALETVTPVLGHLNSEYGYRDHPVNGKYLFHGGVDIGGQSGDPIAAFAAGTVSYVGENKSYGLYLQLDHGNGITSFYAHCKKICVKKGQTVQAGEKIAEVGSSGTATGPHLHLELKCNGLHVNPAYYVEFLDR